MPIKRGGTHANNGDTFQRRAGRAHLDWTVKEMVPDGGGSPKVGDPNTGNVCRQNHGTQMILMSEACGVCLADL